MRNLFLPTMIASLVLTFSTIKSQTLSLSGNTIPTPPQYYLQVKQFGEFIDRFNYLSDWKGNKINDDFAKTYPRKDYLTFLINSEDQRLKDSAYLKSCSLFLDEVTDLNNPLLISLFSGQVTAHSLVNITYMGKPYKIEVTFVPEVLSDRSAKWVIKKVEANCFSAIKDSLATHFIAPNSHETSFINLKRIDQLSNPVYFMSSDVVTNTTLLFMTEVAAHHLTIDNIEKTSYYIDFTHWQVTVDEFVRNSNNSGWLISDVKKLN